MERPDLGRPFIGQEKPLRLIATTRSLEEANRLAEQYELQGFDTRIVKKTKGGLSVYEVWIGKSEILSGK